MPGRANRCACVVAIGGSLLSPVSPTTGIAAGGLGIEEDGFLALETAAVSLLNDRGAKAFWALMLALPHGWMRGRRP